MEESLLRQEGEGGPEQGWQEVQTKRRKVAVYGDEKENYFQPPSTLQKGNVSIESPVHNFSRPRRRADELMTVGTLEGRELLIGANYVTKGMSFGSLRDTLKRERLPWFRKEQITLQIARGLAILHGRGLIHGNLTSENVLIYSSITKITEFYGRTEQRSLAELQKMDIYALGVLMREICTQKSPGTGPAFPDEGYPPRFIKLAQNCCHEFPSKRPTAERVTLLLNSMWGEILPTLFPEGISTSYLMQGETNTNSHHRACLHSLKKHALAPSVLQRLITEKSCLNPNTQEFMRDGWRVYLPVHKVAVNVNESDFENISLGPPKGNQLGDEIILVAARKCKEVHDKYRHTLPPTGCPERGNRECIEFFGMFLCDYWVEVFDIGLDEILGLAFKPLFRIFDHFSARPDLYLFVATTLSFDPVQGRWNSPCLVPACTYSLLAANATDQTVTLANPHGAEPEEFVLKYDEFARSFGYVTGMTISTYDI